MISVFILQKYYQWKIKVNNMRLCKELVFCLFSIIYSESPFGKLIFDNTFGSHRILLPFEKETKISGYEIKESNIESDSNVFLPIYINRESQLIRNILLINIDFIKKDNNKQYKLCIFTEQNEDFHFESFVFDKRENNFVPLSLYKEKKNYFEYAPQICVGLVIGGIAGTIFFLF